MLLGMLQIQTEEVANALVQTMNELKDQINHDELTQISFVNDDRSHQMTNQGDSFNLNTSVIKV